MEQEISGMVVRRGDKREDILRRVKSIYPEAGFGEGVTFKGGNKYEALFYDAVIPSIDKPLALLHFSDSGEVLDCGVFACPKSMLVDVALRMCPSVPGSEEPHIPYGIVHVGQSLSGKQWFLQNPGVAGVHVEIPGAKSAEKMDMMGLVMAPNGSGSAFFNVRRFPLDQEYVIWQMQYLQVGAEAIAIRCGQASIIGTANSWQAANSDL
jgi:hypothetical protein